MQGLEIKAFIKPKYDKDKKCVTNYVYGGFYIGKDTEYKIANINFSRKQITIYTPTWSDIFTSMIGGYSTQNYDFDDIEIVSLDIEQTKLTNEDFDSMIKESEDCLAEQRKY